MIVIGLDNAGKTTMLYKLHLGEVVVSTPTLGSNVEEVKYKNIVFEVSSIGQRPQLGVCWPAGSTFQGLPE